MTDWDQFETVAPHRPSPKASLSPVQEKRALGRLEQGESIRTVANRYKVNAAVIVELLREQKEGDEG